MERTHTTSSTENPSDEQSAAEFYLPATPNLSTVPGRMERFLTNLFRERGKLFASVRRQQ